MPIYEIWIEGYKIMGQCGTAKLLGSYSSTSFYEAVEKMLEHELELKKYHHKSKNGTHSIWACQLFDNELDARKSFG